MSEADIGKLTRLMARLRGPGGCPWDREQSLETLVPFIIEEAYEVISAIDSGDPDELREELGDLLLQVAFCTQLATEKGWFAMAEVIDGIVEKMERRHPHVFGEVKAETSDEVLRNWAEIKAAEKAGKGGEQEYKGYLSGVPESMPALLRAHKVSKKAAKAGFDWPDMAGVLKKVEEEMGEFAEAAASRDAAAMEEELGDLLFTIVNVARFAEVNPEDALRKTIGKFVTRFRHIERTMEERGEDLATASLDEMERLWEEAKGPGRGGGSEG